MLSRLSIALCAFLGTFSNVAAAATYYIDSVSGDDGRNGTSVYTPWQTFANVAKGQFLPGDQILLKRSGVWRETLTMMSSGAPGNPIVIDAYGDGGAPVISGADPASEWAEYKPNIYQAYVSVRPHIVLFDGVLGMQEPSLAGLTAQNQWHWAAGSLYIFSSSDPESAYTKPDIVAGARSNCLILSSAAFVTVRNLSITGGNGGSGEIYADGQYGAKNIEIHNILAENGASDGIRFDRVSGSLVDTSTISAMGRHCFYLVASSSNTFEKNVCDGSRLSLVEMVGGAKDADSAMNTIRYNVLRNGAGSGISASSKSAKANEISYNLIYNLAAGNAIQLKGPGHKIYNNTIFNVKNGIALESREAANASIKNNIFAQLSGFNILAAAASNRLDSDYNNFQSDGSDKFQWGEKVSNLSGWQRTSGEDPHSFVADPKFSAWTPKAPLDFKLSSGSPDIDSGIPLDASNRMGLSDQDPVFSYATVDQNSNGKDWEIGAFVRTAK